MISADKKKMKRKRGEKKTDGVANTEARFFLFLPTYISVIRPTKILIVHFRQSSSFSRFCFFFLSLFFFVSLAWYRMRVEMGGYLFTASKRNQWERQRGQHIFFQTLCPLSCVCVCVRRIC